ncbi:hypothetical protein SVIO_057700 [Streptomyces violaceusniger]|uniref:protein-serine/threonine phosphatase n=1 Tax=Streptomyces violaceusniger TaxID=68280 RepID=A0A4D4L947_STRVO|nr:hypothetical protein SVIO_057700 [Streptomyces violaceusniger]
MIGHHGPRAGHDRPLHDIALSTDHPAAEVVRTGRAVYLPTPEEYRGRFPAAWSPGRPRTRRSWAFLPLIVAGRTIGAWMAGFADPVSFSPDERSVLTTIARMLAQALSRTALQETERELADGLQRSMLPAGKPDIPGLTVAARYVPTGGGLQVGGDWYDVIGLPSGRTALVIGDVQGHDVRAAGIMGQLRIAVRAYASEGHHPDAVLSRASRFLAGLAEPEGPDGRYDPRFATCLYMEVDPVAGTLDIARAGHPDPAVRLADGTMMLRPTAGGLPLGIDPDTDYPTTRVVLEPGETLLMCTDGLIETGGHDLETGWDRIRKVFERPVPQAAGSGGLDSDHLDSDDLEVLADSLVQAVHGPPSHHTTGPLADRREDDIALLLIRREAEVCLVGPGSAPVRRTAVTVAQAEPERIAGARQQLRDLLHDWADPDQVESAVLMLSEMVTNVLVHTDGDALLVAEVSGRPGARRLRLDVADGSDELPHRRRPGELASSGRGLLLMEMLSDNWGVDPRGDGKCIWYELYEAAPDPADHRAGASPLAPRGLGLSPGFGKDPRERSRWRPAVEGSARVGRIVPGRPGRSAEEPGTERALCVETGKDQKGPTGGRGREFQQGVGIVHAGEGVGEGPYVVLEAHEEQAGGGCVDAVGAAEHEADADRGGVRPAGVGVRRDEVAPVRGFGAEVRARGDGATGEGHAGVPAPAEDRFLLGHGQLGEPRQVEFHASQDGDGAVGDRTRPGQPQMALLFGPRVGAHDAVDETEEVPWRGEALSHRHVRTAARGLPPAFVYPVTGLLQKRGSHDR